MTKFNKALLASTAIVFAAGLAVPASAQDPSDAPGVVSSQKKVKLRLYGQIARSFGFVGDGETVTFKQGESSATSTRMGIDGRGKITNDISLRTRFEFNVRSGNEGGGSQFENQGGGASRFTVRHLDVIISSKKFGAVWIGRGDSATNGTSEVNLAPGISSARLGGSTINDIGAYRVLNTDTEPMDRGAVANFFDNFDGASRTNRIRYDTPTFFGFMGSVGLIDKHNVDAALDFKGKIAGTQIAGAVGYCHSDGPGNAGNSSCFNDDFDDVHQLNGSISIKLPMGLGATFSGGTQWLNEFGGDPKVDNPYNLAPSIFYTTKVTELGATTFEYAFQYCKNCDSGSEGNKGMGHMVTALQRIDAIGGDYYVNFNYVDVETSSDDNIEPLWFFGGGFRQRF